MKKKSIQYLMNKSEEITNSLISNLSKNITEIKNFLKEIDETKNNNSNLKKIVLKIKKVIFNKENISDDVFNLNEFKKKIIDLWKPNLEELHEILISRDDLNELIIQLDEDLTKTQQELENERKITFERAKKIGELINERSILEARLNSLSIEKKSSAYDNNYVAINYLLEKLTDEKEVKVEKNSVLEKIAELEEKKQELEINLGKLEEEKSVILKLNARPTSSLSNRSSEDLLVDKKTPNYMKSTVSNFHKTNKKTEKTINLTNSEKEKLQIIEITEKEREIVKLKKVIYAYSKEIDNHKRALKEQEKEREESNEKNRIELETRIKELEEIIEESKLYNSKNANKSIERENKKTISRLEIKLSIKEKEVVRLKKEIETVEGRLKFEQVQREEVKAAFKLYDEQERLEKKNTKLEKEREIYKKRVIILKLWLEKSQELLNFTNNKLSEKYKKTQNYKNLTNHNPLPLVNYSKERGKQIDLDHRHNKIEIKKYIYISLSLLILGIIGKLIIKPRKRLQR